MVTVEFLGPIGIAPQKVEAKSVHDLALLFHNDPVIAPWLAQCAVAVNGKIVQDRNIPLNDGDTVCILPPVCGG